MHLDEERGQRLLHRELPPAALAEAEAHLRQCAECRSAFERLAREEDHVFGALRYLDHPANPVSAATVMTRPESDGWRRWAAGVVLAVGLAGAAYALPGSPVRPWIDRLVGAPMRPPESAVSAPAAQTPMGGVAVEPRPRLEVVFHGPVVGSQMIVRLTPGAELAIRAPGEAATYSADGDRLTVALGRERVTFEVDVPIAARRVEFRVGRRLALVKEGASLVRGGDSLIGMGPFAVPLAER